MFAAITIIKAILSITRNDPDFKANSLQEINDFSTSRFVDVRFWFEIAIAENFALFDA